MSDITLLIDGDSLLYTSGCKETAVEAIESLDQRIDMILENTGAERLHFLLSEGETFRHKLAFSRPYKGNRKGNEPPKWLKLVKEYAKRKYNACSVAGVEADDMVVYLKHKMPNSIICAIDKDVIKQCPGTHYNYQMEEVSEGVWQMKGFVTTSTVDAMQFLYTQSITGDSVDGIPALEKVGEKGAKKLLESLSEEEDPKHAILTAYTNKYGIAGGISKFAETFRLVYMLSNDDDFIREVGFIPEIPEPWVKETPMVEQLNPFKK